MHDLPYVRLFQWITFLLIASNVLLILFPGDPLAINLSVRLSPPSSNAWFGTDDLGRDVFIRTLHGFASTVTIAITATFFATLLGIFLGATAGYNYNSFFDKTFNWVSSVITAVPFLLFVAAVLSLTEPSLEKAYLAVTGLIWIAPARLVRAEVIRIKSLDYVLAARALGESEWRILLIQILPACLGPPIIHAISYLPEVIALEAGLSFLGLGVQPPDPGLGKMVFDGLNYLWSAWWMCLFPTSALALVVTAINIFNGHLTLAANQSN